MEEQEKYDAATQQKELGMMVSPGNSMFLDIERFEFAKKVAAMLAASPMVPKHFQGQNGVGSCMIALNLAERMRVDVFMLMQTMYVVHGNPGLEGKMIIALVNGCGRYEPLEFEFKGEGKTDQKGVKRADECTATAKHIKTGKTLRGPTVTWEMAVAEGWTKEKVSKTTGYKQTSKWQTMPELMFMYRSATFFARTNCPEVLMGLRTKDELEDMIIDVTPAPLKIKGASPDYTNFKDDIYAAKEFAGKESEPDKAEQEEAPEKAEIVTKISKIQNPLAFKKWVIDNASDLVGWPKPRFLELQAKWIKLGLPPEDFPITLKEPEGTPVEGGEPGHPPDDTVICPMTGKPKPLHECEMEGGCPQVGDRGTFPDDACGIYKKAKGT